MRKEAGEHRAPGPPPSCSTSHLAVRAGPAVERAGACTCPPSLPLPPTRRKSLPNTEPERTRSDGCSSSSPGLCLRRRARERHNLGRNGHRAHPIFKRTAFYAQCLRVSPRGEDRRCLPLSVSRCFGAQLQGRPISIQPSPRMRSASETRPFISAVKISRTRRQRAVTGI